jgi:hypothetical protein
MNGDDEIIARMLTGDLTAEEIRVLVERAREDPDLRARLGAQVVVDGLLGVAMEDEFTTARRHREWMAALEHADRDDFVGGVQRRILHAKWRARLSAAAAVAMLAAAAWLVWRPVPVGSVTRLETVRWTAGGALAEGSRLKSGTRLKLDEGLVELEMGGRGSMIVEGPADIEFAGPRRSVLHRGRVVMRVNESGHGYRIETPRGAVVDLGTEFGVSVGENGVETHVLEGEVEAFPDGGGKVLLKKDDALRFDGGVAERIDADGGSFYTSLPPRRSGVAKVIHWPMEGGDGGDEPEVRGFPEQDFVLRPSSLEGGRPPAPIPGVFGAAHAFDGRGGFMESDFPGIGGNDPRTVCFWVKVPRDFNQREGFGIVSWGEFTFPQLGSVWQISINPLAEDGPVGCIRVGAHGGQIVGATDLRDGRWHHVAVVLYPAPRADVGKHVLVYLDGELEPVSRRSLVALDTRIDQASHGVWVGRNVAYSSGTPNRHGGFFRGGVDELFIFDAALSQAEILLLKDRNEIPR